MLSLWQHDERAEASSAVLTLAADLPVATECHCIDYALEFFKLNNKMVVYFSPQLILNKNISFF